MKILAIEKSPAGEHNFTDDDYAPHLKTEAIKAWELYQSGIIRELYFTDAPIISALKDDKSGGKSNENNDHSAVLILECTSVFEARDILNTLPLVQNKLIDFEIIPLIPYPGFKRLFA